MKSRRTVMLLGALICIAISATSLAETSEPIDLVPVSESTPDPIPDPRPVVVKEYDLDADDVEILTRLLWSSPLRSEGYKKGLVWTVLNRAAYGEPFGSSVQECVNKHEFAFYDSHAHRSEENLRIVREAMNEWLSRADGYNPGVVIPRCAFYIRFTGADNRCLELLDINKNVLGWAP